MAIGSRRVEKGSGREEERAPRDLDKRSER